MAKKTEMHNDIIKSLEILNNGGTILYHTDTIWGIGCDATNADAIEKVYKIKKREQSKSMIILLDNEIKISRYVNEVPDIAYDLIELSEKPLTIIFSKAKNLPVNLVNKDGSIAIRIVKDKFCQKLISQFKKPLVSTSANVSNKKAPSIYNEIDPEIINSVDYVVKWRQIEITKVLASGIIKLESDGQVKVIRK